MITSKEARLPSSSQTYLHYRIYKPAIARLLSVGPDFPEDGTVPCPNTRLARGPKIALVSTLVKELPIPIQEIIGDLSDEQRVPSNLKVE